MKKTSPLLRLLSATATFFFLLNAAAQDPKADNMLLFQRNSGGWPKQYNGKAFDYNRTFTDSEKKEITSHFSRNDATIDNGATVKEIRYLLLAYTATSKPDYRAAAVKGVNYLLQAQYKNGGWPQFYPDKSSYRAQVTFNDNAMINVLNLLQDIATAKLQLGSEEASIVKACSAAIDKGIDCIIKTQIKTGNQLTGWCQQYDEITLQPAKARAYELPAISGAETVGVIEFLLRQPNPSSQIKTAIKSAVNWLHTVKIAGFKAESVAQPGSQVKNKQLVADSSSTIWARYYEIETNRPFFCDRDGVKKYSLQDIGAERRNGYAWYGAWAKNLLEKGYPAWKAKHGAED